MTPPTVGQIVRVRTDDNNRLNDYRADLLSSLADRDISSRHYDRALAAIENGGRMIVTAARVDEDEYELCVAGRNDLKGARIPWCFNLDDLKPE